MDTTKLLLGTLVGAVTSFIAGGLVFGLALSTYLETNAGFSASPNFVWIIIGHLILSFLITYIFIQWAGISTLATGAKAGAAIGFLIALGYNSFLMGGTDLFTGGVVTIIVDAIGTAVLWAAGGAGIGWYLGRK